MVIALPAKEDDLMWLVPIIITPGSKKNRPQSTQEARLEYTIPELPATDTITIKFKVIDMVKVLEMYVHNMFIKIFFEAGSFIVTLFRINEDQDDDTEVFVNVEHIEKFYEVLHTQILEIANLQLGLCRLHRIDLPALTIMENKMKVMNTEAMNRVLLYLNEKALDTLHTLQFAI